jgi:transposase-like protein
MSYKSIARRLEVLEAEASRREQAWLEALTNEELEAHLATYPPDPELEAAVEALSDEDLKRAVAGKLSIEEVRRWYRDLNT